MPHLSLSQQELLPWALVLFLLVVLIIALGGWHSARKRTARANRARNRKALRAENEAEFMLEDLGYEILERQAIRHWWIEIDGEEHQVSCRADLLLERGRDRFIADVKSGERAIDPRLPATRRQLLEYLLVFHVDGVLLVDMTHQLVREVSFAVLLDDYFPA